MLLTCIGFAKCLTSGYRLVLDLSISKFKLNQLIPDYWIFRPWTYDLHAKNLKVMHLLNQIQRPRSKYPVV